MENSDVASSFSCPHHPRAVVQFMCAVDRELLCSRCTLDHFGHVYHSLERAAPACRSHLAALLSCDDPRSFPVLNFTTASGSGTHSGFVHSLPEGDDSPAVVCLEAQAQACAIAGRNVEARAAAAEAEARATFDRALAAIRASSLEQTNALMKQEAEIRGRLEVMRSIASEIARVVEKPDDWSVVLQHNTLVTRFVEALIGREVSQIETTPQQAHVLPVTPPRSIPGYSSPSKMSPSAASRSPIVGQPRPRQFVTSQDLTLCGLSPWQLVVPGESVEFRIAIGATAAERFGLGVAEVVAQLARSTAAFITAAAPCAPTSTFRVPVNAIPDSLTSSLLLRFIPPTALRGGGVITIHGIVVDGCTVLGLPLSLSTARHVRAPRELGARAALLQPSFPMDGRAPWCQLSVASDGTVYVPAGDAVLVFDADGARRPDFALRRLGVTAARCAAFDDRTGSLFVTSAEASGDVSVGIDVEARALRWSVSLASDTSASRAHRRTLLLPPSIAIVPEHGMVVASASSGLATVFRASDGVRMGELKGLHCSLAADSAAEGPLISCDAACAFRVTTHRWVRAATAEPVNFLAAAGTTEQPRPLAIVPPPQGRRRSYIVVGVAGTPALQVLSLPDLSLVHTHVLSWAGVIVCGLAADHTGTALLVADAGPSGRVVVLEWPLPGMRPLE